MLKPKKPVATIKKSYRKMGESAPDERPQTGEISFGGSSRRPESGEISSPMNASTNPKNEVRLVPKKEYYGMGERELRESMKSSEKAAQSNPDQLMKDRNSSNKERARATLMENRGKLNVGLPTKKASEVIKNVGKPKPMNDTQKYMMSKKIQVALEAGKKRKRG